MQHEKCRYIAPADRVLQTNNVLANENNTIWIDPSFDEELYGLGETTAWARVDVALPEAPLPEAPPLPQAPALPEAPPPATTTAPAASTPQALTTPEQEWAEFKAVGLGPKPAPSAAAAKLIVSTYRLLGFGVLTAIVVALVGYIALTLFYFASSSWIVPTVVSATDDRVVALQSELAARRNERDRIASELADAEQAMQTEQQFQTRFAQAIESDLRGRQSALRRVRALVSAAATTRAEIQASSDAFARDSAARMDSQYAAGMIDRHAMLDGKHQLAQISSSQLSATERQAAFETQAIDLARQAKALDAVLADKDVPLSYDVLQIKRDYDASKLAVDRATESRKRLLVSLARQDEIIANLESSAYLRALTDHATVALVPYGNLGHVAPGTALYACTLEIVWCRRVGSVVEVLPGEIQFKHPRRDTSLRGQLVELRLTDSSAARNDVLFVGGRPLGF